MERSRDSALDRLLDRIGCALARRLDKPAGTRAPTTHGDIDALAAALVPADVLLVEGDSRIGTAIKYLTQSTWSHATLYVGTALDSAGPPMLVEVEVGHGCIAAPLAKYACANLRICRARGLTDADRQAVTAFMAERIGLRYDMRNILDLLRYLLPEPPVPRRFRRRMLALGSGDPTRAICSSLIAQAFQSIRYPILPDISLADGADDLAREQRREILHVRHHSLFAPRDFDLSPFFEIVKPRLASEFDHRKLTWGAGQALSTTEPHVLTQGRVVEIAIKMQAVNRNCNAQGGCSRKVTPSTGMSRPP